MAILRCTSSLEASRSLRSSHFFSFSYPLSQFHGIPNYKTNFFGLFGENLSVTLESKNSFTFISVVFVDNGDQIAFINNERVSAPRIQTAVIETSHVHCSLRIILNCDQT